MWINFFNNIIINVKMWIRVEGGGGSDNVGKDFL